MSPKLPYYVGCIGQGSWQMGGKGDDRGDDTLPNAALVNGSWPGTTGSHARRVQGRAKGV